MAAELILEGYVGEDAFTQTGVGDFLAAHLGQPVTLLVNSPGGCAFTGAGVMASIERHGKVTAQVYGLAASAASLAIMGAARIVMHNAAHLMIHDPASLSIGAAETHRKAAETLEKVAATYARAYARATGHPIERITEWMKVETWLTAEEAVALHFADEIAGGEVRACAMPSGFDLNAFKHTPEAVRGRFMAKPAAA